MKHLLVTNDFPPKLGGIQSYLWELWRRLPASDTTVLTTPYGGDTAFDAAQGFRVVRDKARVLLPTASLARRINRLAHEVGADLVLLDPALPLGRLAPNLSHPYGVVLHGAEVTVPGRTPVMRRELAKVLDGARLVVAAGGYPAAEARRAAGRDLPTVVVPPGVDTERFVPLADAARGEERRRFGLPESGPLIVSVSRLVPRKGMDVLIRAVARLQAEFPGVTLAVGGSGRDRDRLERIAADFGVPVRFLGRVDDADLPALYGCADVFAMLCRDRWFGLEQEGFGIVFLEAAAAGVPQVCGSSGGSSEAVVHGETGLVVGDPRDVGAVTRALRRLLADPEFAARMGAAGRRRAVEEFTYDLLAQRLQHALIEATESTG